MRVKTSASSASMVVALVVLIAGLGSLAFGQDEDEGRLAVLAEILAQSEHGPRIEEAFTEVLERFGHAVPDLARFLTDEEFLARLDDPEMFMHTRIPDRRLHRLLSRLASASTPEATGVLSSLSSHPIYRDIAVREAVRRRDTLVVALGGLRKPTDQILDFLEESTLGRFPVLAYSVPTLVRMDSARAHAIALAGLERPQEMQYAKFYLAPIRYDVQVVRFYEKLAERLVASRGTEKILEEVLEGLFRPDYRAMANFFSVRGAPLKLASAESLERLVEFGQKILDREELYPARAVEHVRDGLPEIRSQLEGMQKSRRGQPESADESRRNLEEEGALP